MDVLVGVCLSALFFSPLCSLPSAVSLLLLLSSSPTTSTSTFLWQNILKRDARGVYCGRYSGERDGRSRRSSRVYTVLLFLALSSAVLAYLSVLHLLFLPSSLLLLLLLPLLQNVLKRDARGQHCGRRADVVVVVCSPLSPARSSMLLLSKWYALLSYGMRCPPGSISGIFSFLLSFSPGE
jgi:hypothetical protein